MMKKLTINQVHEDDRRSITLVGNLLRDKKEFTFIRLNKNKAIGGCVHDKDEFFYVVSGTIWAKINNTIHVISEGQSGYIPSKCPHMFVGITDAVIIEHGVALSDKGGHNVNMREEVNLINENSP